MGLGQWDLQSDEAIYSYAVDRILETGDWLTPRSIPNDGPFLEKPPLKFWMVAGAIGTGLLPHDESGLRFLDALMGAGAFVYVFLLGRSLSGPMCGFAAVLVLFTVDPLLFDHGLRSNNMDAALVLSYCGGVYHFARWVEGSSTRRQSCTHALAVAAYFTLGFMTKFVAVLFLPLVCATAFAWREDAWPRLRSGWRDWVVPVLVACAASIPWFVYQALHSGAALWETMFAQHVYTRFTGVLDPRHLQPWHYYYSHLWADLAFAGSRWISVIGIVMLAVKAWTGRPWLARLLLVWAVVPMALMSLGTSKLFHYAYPFLPPMALGAGAVADALFRIVEDRIPNQQPSGRWRVARRVLVGGAVLALVVFGWTAVAGRVRWEVHGVELLTSSTLVRPIVAAAILLFAAGSPRRALALAVVGILLPVLAYPRMLERHREPLQPRAPLLQR